MHLTDLNTRTSDSRTIVTYNPAASSGVNFKWNKITSAQKNDLRTNASGNLENKATGKARLDFIRGNRSCEQGSSGTCSKNNGNSFTDSSGNVFNSKFFRQRNSKLGDIVHSSPTFIASQLTAIRIILNQPSTAVLLYLNPVERG